MPQQTVSGMVSVDVGDGATEEWDYEAAPHEAEVEETESELVNSAMGREEPLDTTGGVARRERLMAANAGPWADGLGAASPWAGVGKYCFNMPDHLPASVGARVMVGSVLHATAVHLLRSLGITHVVNCAAGSCRVPASEYHACGIEYFGFAAQDREGYPVLWEHYPAVHAFLQPVLCGQGRVRVALHARARAHASLARHSPPLTVSTCPPRALTRP